MAYFGHVKRHESLEREIYEGIIEGKRGRGRPRRRWIETSLIVSTPPSPELDSKRRIGLHAEKLSLTQRADEHPPPDDDDESALVLVVFEALGLHQLVASLRENKLQVIKKQM